MTAKEIVNLVKEVIPQTILLQTIIESLQELEQERFDNMSERQQESDKGIELEDKITNLEDAASMLGDAIEEIMDTLNITKDELKISWKE